MNRKYYVVSAASDNVDFVHPRHDTLREARAERAELGGGPQWKIFRVKAVLEIKEIK